MHSYKLITSLLAASLAYASPILARDDSSVYHGISIAVVTSPPGQDPEQFSPAPVELNVLTELSVTAAYKLQVQPNVHPNVDINSVECRAYKDTDGQVPGSAPFNVKQEAFLATNPVAVGSVLCYIVTEAEADQF